MKFKVDIIPPIKVLLYCILINIIFNPYVQAPFLRVFSVRKRKQITSFLERKEKKGDENNDCNKIHEIYDNISHRSLHILTHKISFFFSSPFLLFFRYFFISKFFHISHSSLSSSLSAIEKKQQQASTYVHPYSMPHFIFYTLMCKWKLKQYYSSNNISNLLLVLYQHTHYQGTDGKREKKPFHKST